MNNQSDWILTESYHDLMRWDKLIYFQPYYIKLSFFKSTIMLQERYDFNIGEYQLYCLYSKFSGKFTFSSLEEGKLHVDKMMDRILKLKSFT